MTCMHKQSKAVPRAITLESSAGPVSQTSRRYCGDLLPCSAIIGSGLNGVGNVTREHLTAL
ncbi:hypothetical protein OIDMADRAFT_17612, partial [Oidiodendron maius Zn]